MKLAIKKEEGSVPGGGFHYMLHPFEVDQPADFWRQIGYVVVDVPEEQGQRLLQEARQAMRYQLEIAYLCEAAAFDPMRQEGNRLGGDHSASPVVPTPPRGR